ncbi:MAG: ankyrin repeat domain-containing protein [Chitinophagaceae bacterium]|nr:ankyrin repeat domain-containing protein [Chitinophagaceae bacterium]
MKHFLKRVLIQRKKYKGANLLLLTIANDRDLKLASYLETKGLSLKDRDEDGATAFDYAARAGNIELLKKLLEKGVTFTDNALIMAAQGTRRGANPIEVYQFLVDELKMKPTAQSANGENILHILVKKPNQQPIIYYFLAKNVDVNQQDNEGNTVFANVAGTSDLSLLSVLLPKIQNINAVNKKGETALFNAVRSAIPEVVQVLLKNGADAKIVDKAGNNLAYHLVQSYRSVRPGSETTEFTDKVKLLQAAGLDFTAPQKDGSTLFHTAIMKNDINLLKLIADLNVDVNAKNKDGLTALHRAAMIAKDEKVLKYLLSIGAKKDIKTEFDETAFDLASENEFLSKNKVNVSFLQ